MKKKLLIALGVLVGLVAIIFAVGALLPREHVATRSAHFNQPPETVWAAITNYKDFPSWRADLKSVETLPEKNGWPQWQETFSDGTIMPLETKEYTPPQRLVMRITDESLPFGGTWTYELTPDAGGTTLRITEHGFVNPALFRFLSRFVFGQSWIIDSYLKSLGKKFGQVITLQP